MLSSGEYLIITGSASITRIFWRTNTFLMMKSSSFWLLGQHNWTLWYVGIPIFSGFHYYRFCCAIFPLSFNWLVKHLILYHKLPSIFRDVFAILYIIPFAPPPLCYTLHCYDFSCWNSAWRCWYSFRFFVNSRLNYHSNFLALEQQY